MNCELKKTALVLEGGAMRGMYTAAVLDVLMDEGIKVDAIYATSAGVLFVIISDFHEINAIWVFIL